MPSASFLAGTPLRCGNKGQRKHADQPARLLWPAKKIRSLLSQPKYTINEGSARRLHEIRLHRAISHRLTLLIRYRSDGLRFDSAASERRQHDGARIFRASHSNGDADSDSDGGAFRWLGRPDALHIPVRCRALLSLRQVACHPDGQRRQQQRAKAVDRRATQWTCAQNSDTQHNAYARSRALPFPFASCLPLLFATTGARRASNR
jgi:hypothetical protein